NPDPNRSSDVGSGTVPVVGLPPVVTPPVVTLVVNDSAMSGQTNSPSSVKSALNEPLRLERFSALSKSIRSTQVSDVVFRVAPADNGFDCTQAQRLPAASSEHVWFNTHVDKVL